MSLARVRKAVIPAAGLGTRFLPATKAIPKEMLPIVDTPTIQLIIEEAVSSGIEEVILVTARGKEAIENHFSPNRELEESLERSGKKALAELARKAGRICRLTPVEQKTPLGLGHAVFCARAAVGNEPFAVLLGDDLIDADPPCTRQLIDVFEEYGASVVGVMEVPEKEVSKYGAIGGKPLGPRLTDVDRVVEKPQPQDAPSRLVIPGRYVLKPEIFGILEKVKPGRGGEIQLTDGLEGIAKQDRLIAHQFEGTRYDAGDRIGFIDATIAYALKRPELAAGVRALLEKHLRGGGK